MATLAGPPVADRATVWLATARGPPGPIPGADAGSLWAPDGALFGIVWPQRPTNWPTGTTLRVRHRGITVRIARNYRKLLKHPK